MLLLSNLWYLDRYLAFYAGEPEPDLVAVNAAMKAEMEWEHAKARAFLKFKTNCSKG